MPNKFVQEAKNRIDAAAGTNLIYTKSDTMMINWLAERLQENPDSVTPEMIQKMLAKKFKDFSIAQDADNGTEAAKAVKEANESKVVQMARAEQQAAQPEAKQKNDAPRTVENEVVAVEAPREKKAVEAVIKQMVVEQAIQAVAPTAVSAPAPEGFVSTQVLHHNAMVEAGLEKRYVMNPAADKAKTEQLLKDIKENGVSNILKIDFEEMKKRNEIAASFAETRGMVKVAGGFVPAAKIGSSLSLAA